MRNIKLLLKSLILCSTQLIKFVSDWQRKKKKVKELKNVFCVWKKKKMKYFQNFFAETMDKTPRLLASLKS